MTVFALEPLNPPGRVNQFLLAREERVTGGADLQPEIGPGGTRGERISTGTTDFDDCVFWVNFGFHLVLSTADRPQGTTGKTDILARPGARLLLVHRIEKIIVTGRLAHTIEK